MNYRRAHLVILSEGLPEFDLREAIANFKMVRNWAYVKHTHRPDGSECRPHYHLYLELIHSVDVLALASHFNAHPNDITPVVSKSMTLKYLVDCSSLYEVQANFNVAAAIRYK